MTLNKTDITIIMRAITAFEMKEIEKGCECVDECETSICKQTIWVVEDTARIELLMLELWDSIGNEGDGV